MNSMISSLIFNTRSDGAEKLEENSLHSDTTTEKIMNAMNMKLLWIVMVVVVVVVVAVAVVFVVVVKNRKYDMKNYKQLVIIIA